ncbi:MAG: hypothetical protein HYU36_25410 [Planctomycetes bacterium]|nr:hypothetical protein [Planctomycetota bacterium]
MAWEAGHSGPAVSEALSRTGEYFLALVLVLEINAVIPQAEDDSTRVRRCGCSSVRVR